MGVNQLRSTWAAVGAAVAVTLGAGGIGITYATTSSGEKPIYLPIEPCRLADTRPEFQVGDRATPLGADETYTLDGHGAVGNCNLPSGTAALSLNVTALDATAPTFVSLFPAGAGLPVASHLNPLPGQGPTPNAVNVDLSAGGAFSIYNLAGNVNIIVDVVGIFDDHVHDDRYYTKSLSDDRYDDVDAAGVHDTNETLTVAAEIVAGVTVDTPTRGFITAFASTSMFGSNALVTCSITTGSELDNTNTFVSNATTAEWKSLAGTRTLSVGRIPTGRETTVNLVCRGSDTIILGDSNLSVIFTPDPDAGVVIGPLDEDG